MTKEMYTPQIKIVEFGEDDVFCNIIPSTITPDPDTETDEQW